MASAASYAPLPGARADGSYFYLLPATPNAFNVSSLVMYVACMLGLTYYAYAGGPESWVLSLLLYPMLVTLAWFMNIAGGEMFAGAVQHTLPT